MIILLLVVVLVAIVAMCGASFIAWRTVAKNFELQDRHKDYNRFHSMILDALDEDTQFLKTELIRKLSLELPETKQINSSIIKLQTRLEVIRTTLKEYKMLEE